MKPRHIIITILFLTSLIFYYQITEAKVTESTFKITKIIDGDTIDIETGNRLRLKGINTPEKSMPLYQEAKDFLQQFQNQQAQIEIHGTDKYGRILSYIFIENQNINKEILQQGLGTLYYYEKDNHYNELKQAEEFARLNQIGIWKKSPNSNCLELVQLKFKESPERCTDNELLILKNNCNKALNITIKDDATHIYKETIQPKSTLTKTFSCIWNDAGDTLYVSDEEGLILSHRY